MLSNQDKKKIGALVGILIAGTGVLFGALKLNQKPISIVDDGQSGSYHESFTISEDASSGSTSSGPGFATQESLSRASYNSMSLPEKERSASEEKSGNLVVRPSWSSSKTAEKTSQATSGPEKAPSESQKPGGSSGQTSSQKPKIGQLSSERTPEEQSSINQSQALEEEAARIPSTPSSKALADLPVYKGQLLGNTKVYFYQHPSLSVGLDLRKANGMAEQLFAYPTKDGFVIFPRQMMNLLGLDEETLKERLEKGEAIPGSVVVSLVDKKKKEELEKADPDKKLRFTEAEDGRFYVIRQQEEKADRYQKIYDMLDSKLNPEFIAENLSTGGMIGNPPKEADNVTLGQQQSDWEKLVAMMKDNPAVVEWNWNLPLLSSSEGYLYNGEDLRHNVPSGEPTYTFGRMDLNGDQVPEYLIHATTSGSKTGVAAGYWAILEPTPSGLKVANIIPEGNGDLLRSQDKFILPTVDQNEKSVSLTVQEAGLAKETNRKDMPKVTFRVADEGTGKELAEKYPDASVVPMKDKVYLFKMSELEKLLDYAVEVMNDAKYVELVGPVTDAKTGKTNPHGTRETKIEDPLRYLQERYPDLPLTPERLKKATSTATFKDLDAVLTPGDFDRVE